MIKRGKKKGSDGHFKTSTRKLKILFFSCNDTRDKKRIYFFKRAIHKNVFKTIK